MSKKVSLLGIFLGTFVVLLALAACGPKTANLRTEMTDFKFSPDRWSVPAGAKVTLTLDNKGALEHTWIIMKKDNTALAPFSAEQEGNVFWKADVKAGASQTFTFDAPADPGDYEVICGEPAHLEQGMKGTLTVTQ